MLSLLGMVGVISFDSSDDIFRMTQLIRTYEVRLRSPAGLEACFMKLWNTCMVFLKEPHGSRRAVLEPLGPGVLLERKHRAGQVAREVNLAKKRSKSQKGARMANLRLKTDTIERQLPCASMVPQLHLSQERKGTRN